jgi:hypothetical protein
MCSMEGDNVILGQRNFFPFAESHANVDTSHHRKFNHSVQNLGFGMSEFWLFVLSCTPPPPLVLYDSNNVVSPSPPWWSPLSTPTCAEYWPGYPELPASQEFAMAIEVHSATGVLLTGRRYVNSVLESGTSKGNMYWYKYRPHLWPFQTKLRS